MLKRALSLDPGCADCWNALGKAHSALHQYFDAENAFQKAIDIDETNPDFRIALAEYYYQTSQIDMAVITMTEATESEAACPAINYRLAGYLIANHRQELAVPVLEQALSEDFNMHHDFMESFPSCRKIKWIKEMIDEFASKKQ